MIHTGVVGGWFGYQVLRHLRNPADENGPCNGQAYVGRSKLDVLFGPGIERDIRGKVVIDFGCGQGGDTVEMALRGAERVIGVDIRPSMLEAGRRKAAEAGVADRCVFTTTPAETADVVFSVDAFEHFERPEDILATMRLLTAPGGSARIVFGPPWFHPFGGHRFSVFPWAHLLFTESALLRWRADAAHDGARHFSEIDGGLNQMTVSRFRRLVDQSDFEIREFEPVPIRKLRWLANPITREFVTSVVRCRLSPRVSGPWSVSV